MNIKIRPIIEIDVDDADRDKCGMFCRFNRKDSCNTYINPFYKCWDVCKLFDNVKIINRKRCQTCIDGEKEFKITGEKLLLRY